MDPGNLVREVLFELRLKLKVSLGKRVDFFSFRRHKLQN